MPRYDTKPTNAEVVRRLNSLRAQAMRIYETLSMAQTRAEMCDADEEFKDPIVRDRLTDISLATQSLSGEITSIWRKTR